MSKETYAALEDAIAAHIADVMPGVLLTDWSVMAASAVLDNADATRYYAEYSDAPMHTHLGLATMLAEDVRRQNKIQHGDED